MMLIRDLQATAVMVIVLHMNSAARKSSRMSPA